MKIICFLVVQTHKEGGGGGGRKGGRREEEERKEGEERPREECSEGVKERKND